MHYLCSGIILLTSTKQTKELKLTYTNIRITTETHEKLKAVKVVMGQTFDRIILDALKEKHKGLK